MQSEGSNVQYLNALFAHMSQDEASYWKSCYEQLAALRQTDVEAQLETYRAHTTERANAQVCTSFFWDQYI